MNYLEIITELIIKKTGLEESEISAESYIEDDLNIGEMELIEILSELEDDYEIELLEAKDDIEQVSDIVELLHERLE